LRNLDIPPKPISPLARSVPISRSSGYPFTQVEEPPRYHGKISLLTIPSFFPPFSSNCQQALLGRVFSKPSSPPAARPGEPNVRVLPSSRRVLGGFVPRKSRSPLSAECVSLTNIASWTWRNASFSPPDHRAAKPPGWEGTLLFSPFLIPCCCLSIGGKIDSVFSVAKLFFSSPFPPLYWFGVRRQSNRPFAPSRFSLPRKD